MFSVATTLLGLLLLASSAVLVAVNVRSLRSMLANTAPQREQTFAQAQFRRRVQTSAMIGLIGAAMLGAQFLVAPLVLLMAWAAIALLVCWVLLLALADFVAVRQHYSRLSRDNLAAEVRVQAELRREQRMQRGENGHHPEASEGSD